MQLLLLLLGLLADFLSKSWLLVAAVLLVLLLVLLPALLLRGLLLLLLPELLLAAAGVVDAEPLCPAAAAPVACSALSLLTLPSCDKAVSCTAVDGTTR
jgi:hypothetical protein